MLQNAKVAVFTVSELLRENQQGGKIPPPNIPPPSPPTQIRTNISNALPQNIKAEEYQKFKEYNAT